LIRQSGGFAAPRRKRQRSNGRECVWVYVRERERERGREREKSSRREISESSPAIPVRRIWTRVITANCSDDDDDEDDVTSLFFSPHVSLSLVRLPLLWKIHREENLLRLSSWSRGISKTPVILLAESVCVLGVVVFLPWLRKVSRYRWYYIYY